MGIRGGQSSVIWAPQRINCSTFSFNLELYVKFLAFRVGAVFLIDEYYIVEMSE